MRRRSWAASRKDDALYAQLRRDTFVPRGREARVGLLDLHHVPELSWFGRLALANHLGVGLEDAQDLVGVMRVAVNYRARVCPSTRRTKPLVISSRCRSFTAGR